MFKKVAIVLSLVVLSGLSAIVADRYFFPYLLTTKFFTKHDILRRSAQDVMIVNKTEQIYVKESSSVSQIANSVASSVVNVASYGSVSNSKNNVPTFKNGTGTIITSDGFIMTYAEAIILENAKYKITTNNGNAYDAEFVGVDPYSNLAFLKINASNLPVVSFGNSDDIKPGEKVIAIGNNFGNYQNRYATGVVSDFNAGYNLSGKTLSSSEKLEGVLESNFGDSGAVFPGGPIVDYSGQVVGIVGTIAKDNKTDVFQIPANKIKLVIDKSLRKEFDSNSKLGLYYLPLDKTVALSLNLAKDKGALVYSPTGQLGLAVIAGTSAASAGLQLGDIITQINGEEITPEKSLSDILFKYKKGDSVELTIVRAGEERKMSVAL